jgi:hypothetical protein
VGGDGHGGGEPEGAGGVEAGAMTTRQCIYCLEEKDESAFNREHVIPQAFGTFEPDNLVLHCVCKDCNDYFGSTIDLKLGRDSAEGLHRFVVGEKAPNEYKSLGRRSTSRIKVMQDGPMKNMLCKPVPSPDGAVLGFEQLDQVGFSMCEDGPFEFFLLDAIPTRNEMVARGYPPGASFYMIICATPWEKAEQALAARGYKVGQTLDETLPPVQTLNAEFSFPIADPECRALSKIALNYLAAVMGASVALMPEFNDVRAYIREDVRPSHGIVEARKSRKIGSRATGRQVLCHYVSAQRAGNGIIAQVSLYCLSRYVVTLSKGPFLTDFNLSSAHLFDLEARKISEVPLGLLG